MAGSKVKMGVALAACLAVLFQVCSAATSHVVGDSTGWTIPSTTSFYSSWASKETFLVRDFLVFNFPSGAHTVAEVPKSDYDSCSSTSPITLLNNGPANLTISSAGTHYYICTISGHCSAGQKLSITASAAASTTPPTASPAPKSSPSAPTPKSTATPTASPPSKSTAAPTPKSTSSPTASPPQKSTAAPTPKSTTSPTASPAPKSSAAAPTPSGAAAPPPSSGAPTPAPSASSPSPASAPGPSGAGSPETAPTPSTGAGPASSPSPATGAGPASSPSPATSGSLSPPTPLTPTEAPSSTPGSDAPAAGAGLVLPLVVVIGAIFLN